MKDTKIGELMKNMKYPTFGRSCKRRTLLIPAPGAFQNSNRRTLRPATATSLNVRFQFRTGVSILPRGFNLTLTARTLLSFNKNVSQFLMYS